MLCEVNDDFYELNVFDHQSETGANIIAAHSTVCARCCTEPSPGLHFSDRMYDVMVHLCIDRSVPFVR